MVKQMKKLPVGISDFKELRDENKYFVDKSIFIKEIIEDEAKVILLPRPRRFGKTLNLTMLRCFFEIAENKEKIKKLFSGLDIEKEDVFDEHLAQYPVIFLTFKDINETSFKEAFLSVKDLISEEFERHAYLLDSNALTDTKKREFESVIKREAADFVYRKSLKSLSGYLHTHHRKKPVILIDEYDTPIHSAFFHGYYDECISFFKGFLGGGLKDNPDMFKGIITGILRIAKESIFSGLNNLGVYTLLSDKFSDKFGLTQTEIDELLNDSSHQDRTEEIKDWYDGYIFGENKVYNPWSLINYISNIKDGFKAYWANTSSNEILRDLIKQSPSAVKQEFADLLNDVPVTKRIDDNIVLRDLQKDDIAVYSFLLFSGYLRVSDKVSKGRKTYYKLLFPNFEVKEIIENSILHWINDSYESSKLRQMLNALIRCDIGTFEEFLNDFIISTLSYFDTEKRNPEKVYQAFMLGMLVNLEGTYEVYSNKESGLGRFDISVVPIDKSKTAFIMELKTIKKRETKEESLEEAIKQINERKYETEILKRGIINIMKLAIVFDGKEVWVKKG
jgi:hypothetical protein